MYETIVNYAWPASGVGAWLVGTTVLQTRARSQPVDLRLAFAVLTVTMAAYHFNAYLNIATGLGAWKSPAIPAVDIALVALALVAVKRRVLLTERCLLMSMLVLAGSLAFWAWYIGALGGLVPKA